MTDPFVIDGPAQIAFSGGRTSGYMLRRILDCGLRPNVHVVFSNTGKENGETLDFVEEISQRWAVRIRWIEYRADAPWFEEVDHRTASRKGEPFEAMIAKEKYMPNPSKRLCTKQLKIRARHRFLVQELGRTTWTDVVGFRYDEPSRVTKLRAQPGAVIVGAAEAVAPLAEAGITEADVMRFWGSQPFDLRLAQGDGNCDVCFLKTPAQKLAILRRKPEKADWWSAVEARQGMQFVRREPSYKQLHAMAVAANAAGLPLVDEPGLGTVDCGCTD
jgi:3'-phosphoadenosine 5'-phosphosulfate sulfotransferase (PAPS reductase)/FAD synthetase